MPLCGGEESDVRVFARRDRDRRLGSAVSGRMCSRVVKALEERSNFVRSGVARGILTSVKPLEARERVVSDGNISVKSLT